MVCPANCAGHGVCDFEGDIPECRCFDKNDPTVGCFDSFAGIPPKLGWKDNMNKETSSSPNIMTALTHVRILTNLSLLAILLWFT